jgi:hypothetical protein
MPLGVCKLCLLDKELQESHYLPRALYAKTRDPKAKKPNPVLMTRSEAQRTQKQIKDYVLCSQCEQLFSRNGERYVMGQVDNGRGRFPLLNRLNVAMAFRSTPKTAAFSGAAVGIDTEKLAYFALSVLWRGCVHQWNLFGPTTAVILGVHEEPIRKYLLGSAQFPTDIVTVQVTACTDEVSRNSSFPPGEARRGSHVAGYILLTRGIYFLVHLGAHIPDRIRKFCCINSVQKSVLMSDCEAKTREIFADIYKTARIPPDLQRL